MNNNELAIHLTMLLNDCHQWCLTEDESELYHCGIDGSGYYAIPVIDIMDWNQLMPLAIEYEIQTESQKSKRPDGRGRFGAYNIDIKVVYRDDNSLCRAIAICIIELLESKLKA